MVMKNSPFLSKKWGECSTRRGDKVTSEEEDPKEELRRRRNRWVFAIITRRRNTL